MKVDVDNLIAALECEDRLLRQEVFVFTDEERKVIVASLHIMRQAIGHGPFITAPVGKKDEIGLYDGYLICPTLGFEGSAHYKKTGEFIAPEW